MEPYSDLLSQAPMVGLFMLYMWYNGREWRSHMKDRDSQFQEVLNQLADKHEMVLGRVSGKLEAAFNGSSKQLNTLSTILLYHTVKGDSPDSEGTLKEMQRMLEMSLKT